MSDGITDAHRQEYEENPPGMFRPVPRLVSFVEAAAAYDEQKQAQPRGPEPPPEHYAHGIEPWEIIESWDLCYFAGNALKYLLRFRFKGNPVEDLLKLRNYVDKLIEIYRAKEELTKV